MSAKHTPAPWVIELDGTCSGTWPFIRQEGADPDDYPVAELSTTHVIKSRHRNAAATFRDMPNYFEKTENHDEIMANARLIAAAPELLGALIQVRARFQNLRLGVDESATLDRVNAAISKATGEEAA